MHGTFTLAKEKRDIESLLQWAYREELPKQAVGGLTGWEKLIYLGTGVDNSHHDYQLPVALGAPHPDAFLVDHRVRSLPDRIKVDWPGVREAMLGHLACWAPEDDPLLCRMQAEPIALVMMHARMGTRPRWDVGPIRPLRVIGKNGKPVVNGVSPGRRYADGARCPLRLEPPAAEIACARWEFAVWHAALVALANESWNLTSWIPTPLRASVRPWVLDEERKPRIHWPASPRRPVSTSPRTAA